MGRNTPILEEIVYILTPELADAEESLVLLERVFQDRIIVDAGSVELVATHAAQLRLQITRQECFTVLDDIQQRSGGREPGDGGGSGE